MVTLKKDSKSATWIITHTDNEGYHRQLNLTRDDLLHLMNLIIQSDGKEQIQTRAHENAQR